MSYCSNCGKKMGNDDKYCPSCGNSIEDIKPIKEVKIVEKKGGGWGWVFLVVLIIGGVGAFIYFSSSHSTGSFTDVAKVVRSPRLSLSNLDVDTGWSFSQGCYGTIKGVVNNQGNSNAENTYVECSLYKKSGGLLTTSSSQVGTVYSDSNRAFQMNIDFSCLSALSENDVRFDCGTDCSNC